jgi:hypothetical protein
VSALERVVARFPDGTVTFEDGEVTGAAEVIAALEGQVGSCTLVIGLSFDAESFRESGNAFTAAVITLGQSIPRAEGNERWPIIEESEGTEPVPPGDLIFPGPEHDQAVASYRAEMREWRARRRRLEAE